MIHLSGNKHLFVTSLPVHLTISKHAGDDQVECLLCNKKTKVKNLRKHVGRHLLRNLRGKNDKLNHEVCAYIDVSILTAEMYYVHRLVLMHVDGAVLTDV